MGIAVKVNEILLTEEELYEISLKHAIAAGAIGAGMMSTMNQRAEPPPQRQAVTAPAPAAPAHILPEPKKIDPKQVKMAEIIAKKYHVDGGLAQEIVGFAHQYAKPTFPKAKDILAIIGIESSFDPDAESGLKRDPAVGLMQVRPAVWNLNRADLEGNIEKQISTGSDILHLYYKKLKSQDAAVAAYNVGLGEFRSGNTAEGYVSKYAHELRNFTGI